MEDLNKISILLQNANTLPQSPGVYKMIDKSGKIIYVGKSKSLKNRVSQYFQSPEKNAPKTRRMVSEVDRFECVFTETETEALVLENELIKLFSPKYNIKLKDDKSYPYICLSTSQQYPKLSLLRSKNAQGHKNDKLFGPYASSNSVRRVIDTANKLFLLPTCSKKFPQDIGKTRPCLNYHIKQCCGVCTGNVTEEDYKKITDRVEAFLKEDYEDVLKSLNELMLEASENLDFEKAATYRDISRSVSELRNRQKILIKEQEDRDIFGYWSDNVSGCISVLVLRHGKLIDSERILINNWEILDKDSFPAFLLDYYKTRQYVPSVVMLPESLFSKELENVRVYLSELSSKNIKFHCPERGKFKKLLDLSYDNAREYVLHERAVSDKQDEKLFDFAKLLSLQTFPERIEAYDISNDGEANIVAGMICLKNGRFSKKDYRLFNINDKKLDDYSAMREALSRRLQHYINDAQDEKWQLPDLILLDGGNGHVNTIKQLLSDMNLEISVFGMVKDSHHKTRTLVDGEREVSIANNQMIFRFVYSIQEEIHRFSFQAMDKKRRGAVKHSSLEKIKGIGEKKANTLLKHFKSIDKIKKAALEELLEVKSISKADAQNILNYFSEK